MSEDQVQNQDLTQEVTDVNDRGFTQSEEPVQPEQTDISEQEPTESSDGEPDELPLPDASKERGELPKWAEKRLSKKDQLIAQKAAEAEMYKAELDKFKNNPSSIQQPLGEMSELRPPRREDYATEDDYIDARIDFKQQQSYAQRQQIQRQQDIIRAENEFRSKWQAAHDSGAKKYEDFDDKVEILNHPSFPSNRAMAEAIADSEFKEDILYFLGTYGDEARRIAQMNPVKAIMKIAELETRFKSAKKSNVTKAPAPIVPLKSNQGKVADGDPTKMDQQDFVTWYENKYGKKRVL